LTFERRLQKLESVAAERADGDEPCAPWLSAAAEPILRYIAALADECWMQIDDGTDQDAAVQNLFERHPLYRSLRSQLDTGEIVSLRRVQAHLLYIADKRLPFYAWPDPRWRRWRLIECDYTKHVCARSALGASEEQANYDVEAWRESGTTNADVLAVAGIGDLELQLLAADD
jgi:hypothetical protein